MTRRVIDLDTIQPQPQPQPRTLDVRGVGRCVVQAPSWHAELRLDRHLTFRPVRANHRACVDELISACVREPRLSPSAVRTLRPHARRWLRLASLEAVGAASDYRRLGGSHLSANERAYAALRWRADRQRAESQRLRRRLRDQRDKTLRIPAGAAELARVGASSPVRAAMAAVKHTTGLTHALSSSLAKTVNLGLSSRLQEHVTRLARDASAVEAFRATGNKPWDARVAFAARPETEGLTRALRIPGEDLIRQMTRGFLGTGLPKGWSAQQLVSNAFEAERLRVRLDVGAYRMRGLGQSLDTSRLLHEQVRGFAHSELSRLARLGVAGNGLLTTRQIHELARGTSVSRLVHEQMTDISRSFLGGSLAHRAITEFDALRGIGAAAARAFEWAEGQRPLLVVFEELLPRWASEPLAFLLEIVSLGAALVLMKLERTAGVVAVLDALVPALTAPEVVEALQRGVESAPQLSAYNREFLLGGLDHLAKDDSNWVMAVAGLSPGVEGAYRDVARSTGLTRPNKKGKDMLILPTGGTKTANGVEAIFEHMDIDEGYVMFLKLRAYGPAGNPFRHGAVQDESLEAARRHAAALALALAIWLEQFVDRSAMQTVCDSIEDGVMQHGSLTTS